MSSISCSTFSSPSSFSEPGRLYPVAKVIEMVTGVRPSPMQLHRYTTGKGTSGIVLPTVFLGGRKMTCVSDVQQWIADVTAKRQSMTRTIVTKPSEVAKRHAKSEAFLRSEGV